MESQVIDRSTKRFWGDTDYTFIPLVAVRHLNYDSSALQLLESIACVCPSNDAVKKT